MSLSRETHDRLQEAIKNMAKEFITAEETKVTDFHIYVDGNKGDVIIMDDDDNSLARVHILEWEGEHNEEVFEKELRNLLAEMHMPPAPIGVQGRLDVAPLADLGEHMAEHALRFLALRRTGRVIIIKLFQTSRLHARQLLVHTTVQLAAYHFFISRIHGMSPFRMLYLTVILPSVSRYCPN